MMMRRFATTSRRSVAHTFGRLDVRVEWTDCVVMCAHATTLVTSANETLVGTALPYFPRGGPTPPPLPAALAGRTNSWGALETGENFVYPTQAVDGVVSRLGGAELRAACERLPLSDSGARCAVGDAVAMPRRYGALPYDGLVHAVAPFWSDPDWADRLRATYAAALGAADPRGEGFDVATPLLGAGARGAPVVEAAAVAAEATLAAADRLASPSRLVFGVVSSDAFEALSESFSRLDS